MLVGAYVICTIVALLVNLLHYDALLKRLYRHHQEQWISFGKPHGVFFIPEGASSISFYKFSWKNNDERFRWVTGDAIAETRLKRFRLSGRFVITLVVMFLPFVIADYWISR